MADEKDYKLIEIKRITGQIKVITGLRIGASPESMEISGLDNPIIRNPVNDEPYIPGSSLKGKLRSLIEWYLGEVPPTGEPSKDGCVARVFGIPASRDAKVGPTRLIVRDATLSEEDRKRFQSGEPITEIKTENSINRLTAMANPRPLERVVPGVKFDFEMIYRIFSLPEENDNGQTDRENLEKVLLPAMALLEKDYLGSSGSRGCGKIQFIVDGKPGIKIDNEFHQLPSIDKDFTTEPQPTSAAETSVGESVTDETSDTTASKPSEDTVQQ